MVLPVFRGCRRTSFASEVCPWKTWRYWGLLPFWTMAASSLTAGWAADRVDSRRAEAGRIRLLFVTSGLLLCGMMMLPVALVRTPAMSIALVTGACLCLGLFSSNCWAVTQTLAGPDAAGKWTAIQNTIGNFGGVASPLLTGWIVDRTGSFVISFLVTSSILFAGAAIYLLMVRKVVPVTWCAARDESADFKTARHLKDLFANIQRQIEILQRGLESDPGVRFADREKFFGDSKFVFD